MSERKFGRKRMIRSYDYRGECTAKNISEKIEDLISMANYDTDPCGSYTGVPVQKNEVPVQDADDL